MYRNRLWGRAKMTNSRKPQSEKLATGGGRGTTAVKQDKEKTMRLLATIRRNVEGACNRVCIRINRKNIISMIIEEFSPPRIETVFRSAICDFRFPHTQ